MAEGVMSQRDKWERYSETVDTGTSSKRATFVLAVAHALDLIGDRRQGRLLDAGCGLGQIDVLFAKNSKFQITGCDISKRCLDAARAGVQKEGMDDRITIEEGDVYSLAYPDNYFDVVVSFGYASAATYKGAQGEVARVLKPGGLLICDFANFLCLYKIFNVPLRWGRLTREEGKHYNTLTSRGIAEYFGRYNLQFTSQRLFNSYPPVNFLPSDFLIFFDRTAGRFLGKILGRVRIVCFKKI